MRNSPFPDSKDCPCHSGKVYGKCCGPYHQGHQGRSPENALALMRSRYAAYALGLADYILQTTHPLNPQPKDREQILFFSKQTEFCGLDILSFEDGEKIAYVTFTAHLRQNGQDAPFTEKSEFEKVDGRWMYKRFI
jgi:SEC-C motif-containing protein